MCSLRSGIKMSLFQIDNNGFELHEFTSDELMEIYELIKEKKSYVEIKQKLGYINTVSKVKEVETEIKRIESEVLSATLTTKQALIDSIESNLDVETVLDDVIIYNPSYNPSRTWTQFKSEISE
jgi:hypothetical protein